MKSLLIANRGEIARRIMRTAKRMGLRTIAVYSHADAQALHVRESDMAAQIGAAAPRDSYLNIAAIIAAAKRTGADAVHPGYGFLAENAEFAQAVVDAGLTWVGPPPAVIRQMGNKAEAKRIARAAGVPTIPGAEPEDQSNAALIAAAKPLGFPLMVKAAAGGGGRGMRRVSELGELAAALDAARMEAAHAFADGRLLIERALEGARHIEVQLFTDRHGNVIHLGERDCSVQRRHQKLIEESPSPAVDAALREKLGAAAVALGKAVNYMGAGTVEFLLDGARNYYFMEMNTRLQVEHPVTEAIAGIDLVEWQLRVAMGERFTRQQSDIRFRGHAIEARLCAEDPAADFLPQAGRVALWQTAEGVRTDHALESGIAISPFYDSMIAKVAAHGGTRDEARERLARALDETIVLGLPTNKRFLAAVLRDEEFAQEGATTDFLSRRLSGCDAGKPDEATLAIAAALYAASGPFGEWRSWSNNPERMTRVAFGAHEVALRYSDATYHTRVSGSETAIEVLAIEPPRARISIDGAEETVTFLIEDGTVHLARAGHSDSLADTTHTPPGRRASILADGRLTAPMNGRVIAVNATAGEVAEAGRALIVLEAMKMEHALSVPAGARIKALHVAPGAQVAPGQLLVELEPLVQQTTANPD
jgi:geranyl-CoA carboxylase alpha subunit